VSRSAEIRKTLWVAAAKQVSTGPGLIPAQADDKGKTYLPLTNSTAVPGFPLLFFQGAGLIHRRSERCFSPWDYLFLTC